MPSLDELFDAAKKYVVGTKEQWDEQMGRSSMPPRLGVFRGDDQVAMVWLRGDSTTQVPAAAAAAAGFDASYIIAISECWMDFQPVGSGRGTNPVTGKRWMHGEMEDVALNHGGQANGIIGDGVQFVVANRAGDVRIHQLAYRYEDTGIVWTDIYDKLREDWFTLNGEYVTDEELAKFENMGPLVEGYRKAMTAASAEQQLYAMFGKSVDDLGEDWDRDSRDIFTAVALQVVFPGIQVAMAIYEGQQETRLKRMQEVMESMGLGGGLVVPEEP